MRIFHRIFRHRLRHCAHILGDGVVMFSENIPDRIDEFRRIDKLQFLEKHFGNSSRGTFGDWR